VQRLMLISMVLLFLPSSVYSQNFGAITSHADEVKEWKKISRRRLWKDATGKHELRAKFMRFDITNGSVILRKTNGDEIPVLLKKLGSDEQAAATRIVELRELLSKELIVLLTKQKKELTSELSRLKSTADSEKQKLLAEIKRLSVFAPSNSLAADDGIPTVTTDRVNALLSEYDGKQVKMLNCRFLGVDRDGATDRIQGGNDKWISFDFQDSKGKYFHHAFASKENFAEFLLSLQKGEKLNLQGTIVEIDYAGGSPALIATQIEKLK